MTNTTKVRENRVRRWAARAGGRLVKKDHDKYALIVKSTGEPCWDRELNLESMEQALEPYAHPEWAMRVNDDVMAPLGAFAKPFHTPALSKL